MEIKKPTDAEVELLLVEHAHRHPEKARFAVVGDGGAEVLLPVLLGNPSGACKMPAGKPATSSWDDVVSSTFKMRPDAESDIPALVRDCVLWPPQDVWSDWCARWAALPEVVHVAIRRKSGWSKVVLDDPPGDLQPPDLIAMAKRRNAGAVWQQLKPPGSVLDVAISPPDSGLWRMFLDAMKRPRESRPAELARDLAASCTMILLREDGTVYPTDEALDRWPGLALLIGIVASNLAGITSRYELGGW